MLRQPPTLLLHDSTWRTIALTSTGFSTDPIPFANLSEALAHWNKTSPEALALTEGGEELTWSELATRVGRCRMWLREQGIRAGDRVVIVGHNTIPWVIHYLAVLGLGAVVAPANNRLNPSQFADQAGVLGASLVLRDADHVDIASEITGVPVVDLSHEFPETVDTESAVIDPDAPALISFTSGTTGRPKGATLSQAGLAEASWAFVRVMHTTSDDSTLVLVPMFHNTGFIDQFGHMLLVGGRTDLLRKFRTALAVETLARRPVTYLAAVPSIHRLIMLADGADQAFSQMRILLYGGSPMPHTWIEEYLTRWPDIQLFHGYGLTECGSAISFLPPRFARDFGESIGLPVPFTTVRIVGDDGSDVTPGEIGELWSKSPTNMLGYWQQPELTAQKLADGWLRTGDLVRLTDGLYFFEGRVDDVINRGGEKVLPAHIEGLLAEIPEVALGCVFAVPDSILQNRVFAAVEPRPGTTFDEQNAIAALRTQLPDYAVPERVFSQTELPRTASGKVDRRAVAALFEATANERDHQAQGGIRAS